MPLTLTLQSFSQLTTSNVIACLSTGIDGAEANGESYLPEFSADGRYMVFLSEASNLVQSDTNTQIDVFRKDLVTGETMLVSIASDGSQANDISNGDFDLSADGRYVVFSSNASNLVDGDTNNVRDIFRKDLTTGDVLRVSTDTDWANGSSLSIKPAVSADGRYVVFESDSADLVADDTNGKRDIFRKDLTTGEIICVSRTDIESDASSRDAKLSADGRYVVFTSAASNLVPGDTNGVSHIYRKDLQTGQMTRLSAAGGNAGTGNSDTPALSGDGRYVVFASNASNLVPGDNNNARDIFRKDLQTGEIVLVSTAVDGTHSNGMSVYPVCSSDGRYVAFTSFASNLDANDAPNTSDVFRKDLVTGEIIRLSVAAAGVAGNAGSHDAAISADGRFVAFQSDASNLVASDNNSSSDVFLVDTRYAAYGPAIATGRFAEIRLGVGNATQVSLAWGDGSTDTVTPSGGSAAFRHVYGSAGIKAAIATVHENGQSWSVPYLINPANSQMIRNTALADTLAGSVTADRLTGDDFANRIIGNAGNDIIKGLAGNDTIFGGAGNDVLYGGSGKDTFVFDTKLGTAKTDRKVNFDKIADFNVKDDTIWLDNAIFKKLGKGTLSKPKMLNAKFFVVGDKAKDANDYLIYDKKTGVLSYDADGSGTKIKAVEIAQLKKGLAITYKDFFVI